METKRIGMTLAFACLILISLMVIIPQYAQAEILGAPNNANTSVNMKATLAPVINQGGSKEGFNVTIQHAPRTAQIAYQLLQGNNTFTVIQQKPIDKSENANNKLQTAISNETLLAHTHQNVKPVLAISTLFY